VPADRDSGVYVIEVYLPHWQDIRVGRLGILALEAGVYLYVGSARRALRARLARHTRPSKPRHWHIDYLTACAHLKRAVVWEWEPGRECRIAGALRSMDEITVPVRDFGASDCRCGGHLFAVPAGLHWQDRLIGLMGHAQEEIVLD